MKTSARLRLSILALLALPLLLFAAACSGDDDDNKADDSTTTATSEATKPAVEVPAYPADKRTGEASLDAVIDAVLAGKAGDQVEPSRVTCDLAAAWGMGTPPKCETGEGAGTVVNALAVASCDEDYYVRGADLDKLVEQISAGDPKLYAAFEPKINAGSPAFPPGAYVAVFVNNAGEGFSTHVADKRIVRVGLSCGTDLENLFETSDKELLPPLD